MDHSDLPDGFKILSWNIQGMMTRIGDDEFQKAIKFYNLLCFQETFLKNNKTVSLPGFLPGFFRNSGNGVAIFVREEFGDQIKLIDDVGYDCVVWVHANFKNSNTSYCIACVYNPPASSQYKNENFFENLLHDVTCLKHRFSDPHFILVGDWNSRIGPLSEYNDEKEDNIGFIPNFFESNLFIPRSSCDSTVNTYGKKMISFCRESGLYILNGRGSDPHGEFTYLSTRGMSTIDYGLVNLDLMFDHKVSFFVCEALCTPHKPLAIVLLKKTTQESCKRP